MTKQEKVSALYKKLLNLYPQRFRDPLGESMQQTFNDLYREKKTEDKVFSFMVWTFAETATGVVKEYVLLVAEGFMMKTMLANPISAVVISFIFCVLPFMVLEWATRSNLPRSDASPMLWIVMWFLSAVFIGILIPMARNLRQAVNSIQAKPVSLLVRVGFLVLFAWIWGFLVMDQMPCFLGGSGC